jgi:hypothetical protein
MFFVWIALVRDFAILVHNVVPVALAVGTKQAAKVDVYRAIGLVRDYYVVPVLEWNPCLFG